MHLQPNRPCCTALSACMLVGPLLAGTLLTGVLPSGRAFAQQQLPTVEEATAISKRTGRPIFAMAGRET